jgi:hypothetical protein
MGLPAVDANGADHPRREFEHPAGEIALLLPDPKSLLLPRV